MTLRSKLLLVGLSLLVLPWAGWQVIRQLEALLRQGQQQALVASAEALARGVAMQPQRLPPSGPTLFVQALSERPRLDGSADDWRGVRIPNQRFALAAREDALELTLARAEDSLHLFIRVRDASPQRADAHWPIAVGRDHLRLLADGPHGLLSLRLANAASGALISTNDDRSPAPLRPVGEWRELGDGYAVELALPQGYSVDALGLSLIDADAEGRLQRTGTGGADIDALWALTERSQGLAQPLQALVPPGMRARLLDGNGWVLAEAGQLAAPNARGELPIWRRWMYRWLLMRDDEPLRQDDARAVRRSGGEVALARVGQAATTWRRDSGGQRQVLSAAVPVRVADEFRGVLLLERENEAAMLFADRALSGLLGTTVLALLVALGAVFWFASRLSGRIRRLRDAAETALDREGRVHANIDYFRDARSGDEVGDLSRSFGRLLAEVAAYTEYLRSLASKLSHELNTPLAIVRSSLDNLEPAALPEPARPYLERARGGVDRLGALVRAMSEASRIEHAIAAAEGEHFDLRALVAEVGEAYRPLLAPRRLELDLPAEAEPLHGVPDLIAQALDKLIDNARGFTAEDGWVRIVLESDANGAVLRVANQGPLLPEAMAGKLFDSLVSVREKPRADGGVHLGFGLYVVRLIAELHRGDAQARNLPIGEGVEFELTLRGVPRR